MEWREAVLRAIGPGFLGGITFRDWMRVLRRHGGQISPSCWPRAAALTSQSLQNSLFAALDRRQIGDALLRIEIPPPLFVLGHWRSGTTHLHNLLALDPRFAFPNNYQALFPHSFLTAERLHSKAIEFFLPKRRPMDNIEWNMRSAQEDEFALCILTQLSPCMGWIFPHRKSAYERYLTFREASSGEVETWKSALVDYLRKLTWKHGKPLVLKSPPHTGRVRLLLELFPQAKFLHIHRDPQEVFASTRRMLLRNATMHCLQRGGWEDIDDWVLRQYELMYGAFLEDRSQIPAGRLHEVGFASLERDPIETMRRAYAALDLPPFVAVEPEIRRYLDSIAGYEKNRHEELSPAVREAIRRCWEPIFEVWGYRGDAIGPR